MITEQQSSTYDIRDGFFNALDADPYFANYTRRTDHMSPVQQDLTPYLGVYLIDELMLPDGDANAGCIRFLHNSRIGFSVVQAHNDRRALERGIDQAYLHIMNRLWTDAGINNVWKSSNPEGTLIEALTRGTRRHVWGPMSARNETPFCELEYVITATFRSEWFPDITDMLDEIDVTTVVNNLDPTGNVIQPVIVKYTGLSTAPLKPTPQQMMQVLRANIVRPKAAR